MEVVEVLIMIISFFGSGFFIGYQLRQYKYNKINKMKAEFELTLDSSGMPCIKFKHYDKNNSLDQKTLKLFIDSVKEKGCVLKNPNGYLESGTSNSWENYEIQIGK